MCVHTFNLLFNQLVYAKTFLPYWEQCSMLWSFFFQVHELVNELTERLKHLNVRSEKPVHKKYAQLFLFNNFESLSYGWGNLIFKVFCFGFARRRNKTPEDILILKVRSN